MIGEIRLRNCACERRLPHFWESLCFVNLVCGDVIMAMIIRTANLTCLPIVIVYTVYFCVCARSEILVAGNSLSAGVL